MQCLFTQVEHEKIAFLEFFDSYFVYRKPVSVWNLVRIKHSVFLYEKKVQQNMIESEDTDNSVSAIYFPHLNKNTFKYFV